MEFSPEVIAQLESEHGPIDVGFQIYESDFGSAAFRPPKPQEWQRYLDEMNQEALKSRALKHLVFSCAIAPDKAEFQALIDSRPGLVQGFGNQLVDFAGMFGVRVRKK